MWFCGYDLHDPLPNHSVLSKARQRWGPGVFAGFFQRVLPQCLDAGLVDGRVVHVDGSVIEADADQDRLQVALQAVGQHFYQRLNAAEASAALAVPPTPPAAPGSPVLAAKPVAPATPLAAALPAADAAAPASAVSRSVVASSPAPAVTAPSRGPVAGVGTSTPAQPGAAPSALPPVGQPTPGHEPAAGVYISPADPDARLTRKNGRTYLGYKDHRVVDDRCGIITATLTTDAAVAEAHMLGQVLAAHTFHTGGVPQTPVADKGYGTTANYQELREQGLTPCIPHPAVREDSAKFPRASFIYDAGSDSYRCPAGQTLTCRGPASDGRYRYQAGTGVCAACPGRGDCTNGKKGRLLSRNVGQEAVDWADTCLSPAQRRSLMKRRKVRAEGSFADAANRHGYKRARWRGLGRVTIQNLLIATIQNVRKLLRYGNRPRNRPAAGGVGAPRALATLVRPTLVACLRDLGAPGLLALSAHGLTRRAEALWIIGNPCLN
jgi:IS5 family transposase